MKLRRIEIENFRPFAAPLEIEIDDFTAFIGRNDVGKSSILAALTIFLEGDGVKLDQNDGSVHGNPSKVRITCEFDDLPDKIILDDSYETNLAEEHILRPNGRLRITKMYDCTKSKISSTILINAENHPVDKDGNSLLPLTITDLKKVAENCSVVLETGEKTIKALIRRAIVERSDTYQFHPVDIPIDKNETKTLWEQILKYLPMCALFISDRSSSDQDPEAQSPMGVAVEQALAEIEGQLVELSTHVEKRVVEVAQRTLAKLKEMNSELAEQLKPQMKDKNIKWKSLFKYTLSSDLDVPMDKRGSGVRRLVLLNFFRAEAERKAFSEGQRPIIYAIEEPETSQHPDHQRILMRALLEISETTGQVLVSTHAPGLAGEVPVNSLRLIDMDESKCRSVRSANSEDPSAFYSDLAEKLGMLPDNLIRVLICVEGANDIRFLRHISRTLNASDPNIPDLSRNPNFAIIPMRGGNLRDVVNLHLFKNFHKPEFHIYDRDDNNTYEEQALEVNNRGDGSKAVQTSKRTMENYIHSAAISRITGQTIEVMDDNDLVACLCGKLGRKKSEVKAILCDEVAPEMTADEISERDSRGEIRSWLKEIASLAEKPAEKRI
ncbi:MAG: ATP-binding protein [Thermodesulfobacteriota bacterium]